MSSAISNLDVKSGTLVLREHSDVGVIEVREQANLRWMHFDTIAVQSVINISEPQLPVLNYSIAMLYGVLFQDQLLSLLSLGYGGGTFERFIKYFFPQVAVTSVESNTSVIAIANRVFSIAETSGIVNARAENYLSARAEPNDIILCDIFNSSRHPACIADYSFYQNCRNNLAPHGILIVNLLFNTQEQILEILLRIRKSFKWVYLFEVPECQNVILYCLNSLPPATNILVKRALELSHRTTLNFNCFSDKLKKLPPKV